jgi:hypothetical protein
MSKNDQKMHKNIATFLYQGGHEQSLHIHKHYLWQTKKKDDMPSKPGACLLLFAIIVAQQY